MVWSWPCKTVVGDFLYSACNAAAPPNPSRCEGIESRHIGLDVDYGRSIENIDISDVEYIPFEAQQPHRRKPKGIWTAWSTRGEDPMRFRVAVNWETNLCFPPARVSGSSRKDFR